MSLVAKRVQFGHKLGLKEAKRWHIVAEAFFAKAGGAVHQKKLHRGILLVQGCYKRLAVGFEGGFFLLRPTLCVIGVVGAEHNGNKVKVFCLVEKILIGLAVDVGIYTKIVSHGFAAVSEVENGCILQKLTESCGKSFLGGAGKSGTCGDAVTDTTDTDGLFLFYIFFKRNGKTAFVFFCFVSLFVLGSVKCFCRFANGVCHGICTKLNTFV